jgi:hypothetical protein
MILNSFDRRSEYISGIGRQPLHGPNASSFGFSQMQVMKHRRNGLCLRQCEQQRLWNID